METARSDSPSSQIYRRLFDMDTSRITALFNQLITAGLALAVVVCTFFLMWGGYQYMTSAASNNALRMESGKTTIRNALIGLAIVVLARVIATQVRRALGA